MESIPEFVVVENKIYKVEVTPKGATYNLSMIPIAAQTHSVKPEELLQAFYDLLFSLRANPIPTAMPENGEVKMNMKSLEPMPGDLPVLERHRQC